MGWDEGPRSERPAPPRVDRRVRHRPLPGHQPRVRGVPRRRVRHAAAVVDRCALPGARPAGGRRELDRCGRLLRVAVRAARAPASAADGSGMGEGGARRARAARGFRGAPRGRPARRSTARRASRTRRQIRSASSALSGVCHEWCLDWEDHGLLRRLAGSQPHGPRGRSPASVARRRLAPPRPVEPGRAPLVASTGAALLGLWLSRRPRREAPLGSRSRCKILQEERRPCHSPTGHAVATNIIAGYLLTVFGAVLALVSRGVVHAGQGVRRRHAAPAGLPRPRRVRHRPLRHRHRLRQLRGYIHLNYQRTSEGASPPASLPRALGLVRFEGRLLPALLGGGGIGRPSRPPSSSAMASISTRAPPGKAPISTVERAGGRSPTWRRYTSFIPAKLDSVVRNTVVLTSRSSPLPAASRMARMFLNTRSVCSSMVVAHHAPRRRVQRRADPTRRRNRRRGCPASTASPGTARARARCGRRISRPSNPPRLARRCRGLPEARRHRQTLEVGGRQRVSRGGAPSVSSTAWSWRRCWPACHAVRSSRSWPDCGPSHTSIIRANSRGPRALEPPAEPPPHERAVAGDGGAVAQIVRRPLPEPLAGQAAHVHRVGERQAQPEHVVREIADRAVALGRPVVHVGVGHGADQPLRDARIRSSRARELGGESWAAGAYADAEQRRVRGGIPAVDGAIADRHGGQPEHAELIELGRRRRSPSTFTGSNSIPQDDRSSFVLAPLDRARPVEELDGRSGASRAGSSAVMHASPW